jgi:mannose-6-phosphate isomerase
MTPILKPKVWGGRRLESLNKTLPPDALIGESWELADLPDGIWEGQSTIANGELAGCTLRDALASHRRLIMGHANLTDEGGFPLLLKYLDANENLSVQVHPDARYAARHPGAHMKSEAWVILHAEPGSVIYKGVRPGVTRERFADHIRSGRVVDDLVEVEARSGDCHYLPSGTCHALGAGILLAEVQTPSDTTFRVYDWGRPQSAGRELHIEQALECIRFGDEQEHAAMRPEPVRQTAGSMCAELCRCDHFRIERVEAGPGEAPGACGDSSGAPEVWMMISGSVQIESPTSPAARLSTGATALLPAALQERRVMLDEQSRWLRITLPSEP